MFQMIGGGGGVLLSKPSTIVKICCFYPDLCECNFQAQKEQKEAILVELDNLKSGYGKISKRVHTNTEKVIALSKEVHSPLGSPIPGH